MKTPRLPVPEELLKSHLVTLGKTGAGKSSVLRVFTEFLLSHGKRVCIIDPKGDWYGLTSSADGRSEGFPVVMFGDFKNKRSDVPMDGAAGKTVAEVVCSSNQACVLGFRGWMPADLTRFWLDFAPTVFNHNAGELFLVIDEVHNFAPKGKILDPNSARCLHWTNRLASEGRGLGLKLLIASQRPQKVHNDTLTCCETLVAMRVIHEADRNAVKAWIDGCGDSAHGKQVLADLAQMKRGEAWVWSPEAGFLDRVQFPMFKTFDSFAEGAGQQPQKWASVDVEEVRQRLARVVQEQEDNDPKKLRYTVALFRASLTTIAESVGTNVPERGDWKQPHLNKLIHDVHMKVRPAEAEPEQIAVLTDDEFEQVCDIRRQLEKVNASVPELMAKLEGLRTPPQPARVPVRPPARPASPARMIFPPPAAGTANGSAPSGGKRRMMIALAQRPGLTCRQLGVRAGLSSSSGSFRTYLSSLRTEGLLDGDRHGMSLTPAGIAALGAWEPLPTGRALLDYWTNELGSGGITKMLTALASVYPARLTPAALGQLAGLSHTSGSFRTYLSRLRTLELVSGSRELEASPELFD